MWRSEIYDGDQQDVTLDKVNYQTQLIINSDSLDGQGNYLL